MALDRQTIADTLQGGLVKIADSDLPADDPAFAIPRQST